MIPVRITRRAPRILRNGELTAHREAWEAVSVGGLWSFERLDEPSTPWMVRFAPCPDWYAVFGSLSRARKGAEPQFCFDFCMAFIHALGLERPRRPAQIYVA